MRKLILGAAMALVLPVAAAAAPQAPTPTDLAKAACKTEKAAMGAKLFKQTYAVKSMSKARQACVAKAVPVAQAESKNAAKQCKTERDAGRTAFEQKYGTNENKKNALGKCVSGKAKAAMEEAAEDRAGAAETCKALKRDDAAAFAEAHGVKKNAFGKCVSATARAADDA
jgi:hypothetical protein